MGSLLPRVLEVSPTSNYVIFLPGLDSASSLEILKSLQEMAGTGRAVVVTIHQPRSEIFHAFDKILLLCKGQVAFFGSPVKVWEFFRRALIMEKELEVCSVAESLSAVCVQFFRSVILATVIHPLNE